MSFKYNFSSYLEIPEHIKDYILNCSSELDIKDITLEDINDFLNGIEDYENELSDDDLEEELDAMLKYYHDKKNITIH